MSLKVAENIGLVVIVGLRVKRTLMFVLKVSAYRILCRSNRFGNLFMHTWCELVLFQGQISRL